MNMRLFKKKKEHHLSVIDFYTMLRHYDVQSNNIAVIEDAKKFKNIIKHFKNQIKPLREDKVIKAGDEKYIFIKDEIDTTVMLINKISDLDNTNIVFGKYI